MTSASPRNAVAPRPCDDLHRGRDWRRARPGSPRSTLHRTSRRLGPVVVAACQRVDPDGDTRRIWLTAKRGTPRPDHAAYLSLMKQPGSWPELPSDQRAVGLQNGDRFVQQLTLNQRGAEFDLQPVAFQFLAGRGLRGQRRLAGSGERVASRQPLSVAAATPKLRDTVSRSSPRNNRSTATVFRCLDILPPRPGAATPELVWSLRVARPCFDACLLVHLTPLSRKSSASEMSQSNVGRGNGDCSRATPVIIARANPATREDAIMSRSAENSLHVDDVGRATGHPQVRKLLSRLPAPQTPVQEAGRDAACPTLAAAEAAEIEGLE